MHNYATKITYGEKRRVQMQDTGDALAIKRPTTKNNLVYKYIYIYIYIYIYTHTHIYIYTHIKSLK